MNASAEPRPTAATVSAYEVLRRRYLERQPRVDGERGLSVLLRQGMLAWTRACSPLFSPPPTQPPPLPNTTHVPSPLRDGLIDVLVSMVMDLSRTAHNGAPPA